MRELLRDFAQQGGGVLLSSHSLAEVEEMADTIIMVNHGRTIWSGSLQDIHATSSCVVVSTTENHRLLHAIATRGLRAEVVDGVVHVFDCENEDIGRILHEGGFVPLTLTTQRTSLEDAYLEFTTHSAIQRPLSFVVAKTMWPALACAVGTVAMMVVVVPLENWLLAGTPYSLFDAAVRRQIAALAFVTVSAVSFAAGIALILRHSATALGLCISIILIAPIIIGQIPVDTAREIAKWLPNNVFNFLTTNAPDAMATLNYPLLTAAAIAYPLAVLAIGFLRLRRRVV